MSELSKYIWDLKSKGEEFTVKWKVVGTEQVYNKNTGKCQICTREKLEILKAGHRLGRRLINKKEELFRGCLHRYRFQLGMVQTSGNSINFNVPLNLQTEQNGPSGVTRSGRRWRDHENDCFS